MGAWSPTFDFGTATFHLNVSSLPFPIKSGSISYIYKSGDAQYCGSVAVVVVGNDLTAQIPKPQLNIYEATIVDFNLTDVCEQQQDYDPVGVACWQLVANSESGSELVCTDVGGSCPAPCQ